MGSGDAGGVLVAPAPASLGGPATAVGRLLEPELIALSSHGGHHLFINRIPPRLPKEDVEKIILAQLRLHPFVLQVSKCSVIPQNSLKNKGYGFITLDGSPSPSDLDAIADSLNNKLQVGCRTLGVRVCTDCHSACYVDDDGCASSSSRCSTPPNEPTTFGLQEAHTQAATDPHLSVNCLNAAVAPAAAEGDALRHAPFQAAAARARLQATVAPQRNDLQTAVAVLAKQHVAAGPSSTGQRRRKVAKPHDLRSHVDPHSRHHHQHQHLPSQQQQQYQGHGAQEGSRWRAGRGRHNGNGNVHAAGRHRRNTADVSPWALGELVSQTPSAPLQVPESDAVDRGLGLAATLAGPLVPPQVTALWAAEQPQHAQQEQQVLSAAMEPQLQQPASAASAASQQVDGCGLNAAPVSGSPRSVSSYSSASGSGPASASNSAPGSVTGTGSGSGSGRASVSSVGGWFGRDDSADVRMILPSTATAALPKSAVAPASPSPVGMRGTAVDTSIGATASAFLRSPLNGGISNQPPTSQHQPLPLHQQPKLLYLWEDPLWQTPRTGRDAEDGGPFSGMPPLPLHLEPEPVLQQPQQQAGQQTSAGQMLSQSSVPHLALAHERQTSGLSSGPLSRRSRSPNHGSRATPSSSAAAAPISQGRAAHRQSATAAQVVPVQPAVSTAAPSPSPLWTPASGLGPMGQSQLHSASAPTSSAWYLHHYHRQHQDRQRHMPYRQSSQQQIPQHAHPGPNTAESSSSNSTSTGVCNVGSCAGGGATGGGSAFTSFGSNHLRLHFSLAVPGSEQAVVVVQGPPRVGPALADGNESEAANELDSGVDRRGSYPGGPSAGTPRPATRSQPQVAQPQLQHQPPPASQLSLRPASLQPLPHQHQQSPPALYPMNRAPCSGAQSQQPQSLPNGASQITQQQQPVGFFFPSQQQQQQSQLSHQGLFGKVQLGSQQTQQQQQTFNGGALARSSTQQSRPTFLLPQSCLSTALTPPAAPLLPLQLNLVGSSSGLGSDGLQLGSSVPSELVSAPSGFAGWRACSFELDFDMRRAQGGVVARPLSAAGQMSSLAAAAALGKVVSVRSAELLLGRGSSEGIEGPADGSADSAELDPLDLEPMILQLLENDDDSGGCGRSSAVAPPTAAREHDSPTDSSKPESQWQQANGQREQQPKQQQRHRHHKHNHRQGNTQQQQQHGGLAIVRGSKQLPQSQSAAAPQPLQPLQSVTAAGFGAAADPKHGDQQPGRQSPPQRHLQPGAGTRTALCPAPPGTDAGDAVAAALPQSRTNGSSNGNSSSAGSTAGPAASAASSPSSAVASAHGSSPALALAIARLSCLSSWSEGLAPAVQTASAATAPKERIDATSCPGASSAAAMEATATPGRGCAVTALRLSTDLAGCFSSGMGGGLRNAGAGGHRLAAGGGGGSAGGDGDGRGIVSRGPRHHGVQALSGQGDNGGGRGAESRAAAMGGGSAGTGGGFNARGFVIGSLPNADLLLAGAAQRLDV